MKYVQIQKNSNYTLQFKLNQSNECLFLRLQIEEPKINKINVYQTQIKSNAQIGQMFGGLTGLTEYLEDPSITKINVLGENIELKIVSKNLVKGKQRQINLYKIIFQRKSNIISQEQKIPDVQKQQVQFQKQMRNLQEQKQEIQNEELRRILIKIIRKITESSKEMRAQIQTRIDLSEMLNRSIEKQLLIGLQQQAIKDKFRSVNQRVEGLWQRVNRQSVGQKQNQRQRQLKEKIQRNKLQQKIQRIRDIHYFKIQRFEQEIQQLGYKIGKTKQYEREIQQLRQSIAKTQLYEEQIQQLREKITEENHQIQKIKTEIKRLQKQFSETNHQIMFKNNLPLIQHGHFHSLEFEKFGHQLQFSKTMKNEKIRVINDYSIQGVDDSRGKIAIIGPSIESRKKYLCNNQISVVLKVNKFSANVLFGVCDIQEVKNLRYKIESWAFGKHGGYYINSGSYIYSSYRNEDNSQMRGFKFYDGEPIKIICDTNKKRITFSNNNEQFIMAYRPNLDESKLFFGVVLHKNGSVVEIVQ